MSKKQPPMFKLELVWAAKTGATIIESHIQSNGEYSKPEELNLKVGDTVSLSADHYTLGE